MPEAVGFLQEGLGQWHLRKPCIVLRVEAGRKSDACQVMFVFPFARGREPKYALNKPLVRA